MRLVQLRKRKNKKQLRQDKISMAQAQELEETKEEKRRRRAVNKDIMRITYIFIGLFMLLIGYYTYFLFVDSERVINNSYNKRQSVMEETVTRGKILGSNGEVLAETIEGKDGETTRYYPYRNVFSHVVGRYLKGKTGLESSQGFTILQTNVNPIKKAWNDLSGKKTEGDNIVTTLNVELQKQAYEALGNRKGAVVVMEPSTGKVLTMVSKPDYDPNKIAQNWDDLVDDSDNNSSLVNRATQGLYPPGSTFKLVTALAYMRENENYEAFTYECKGSEKFGDMTINCYKNKKHGTVNLESAMAKSCNSAFAKIGSELNITNYKKITKELLFNVPMQLDFSVKESSFTLQDNSSIGEITQTAIGQGNTLVTPFHNAMIVSAIANGGTLMKPYLVDRVESADGNVVDKTIPQKYTTFMTTSEAGALCDMMEAVVQNGTATGLRNQKYTAAGKTGSAEFNSGKESHAWFVGYAATDQPDVVVSVIVEGAGTGSDYAVPIAKKIFATYYKVTK